ncbi:MAG TPA: glycosyltransferase family 2 protein [Rubricoccaceae bacterium]|jgi:glycosyltransferase involved in cell wall biosynthesis
MMQTVPVSVIVPNYNSGTFLTECIRSVNAGTPPEQIVIVDDASTDDSLALARRLAHEYSNVDVIACSENGGVVAARQRGLEAAICSWIAHVDADDALEVNAVAAAYGMAVSTDSDLCVWQVVRIEGEKRWPHIDLLPQDFPMTGREAARRTLGVWQMHLLGVGKKCIFQNVSIDEYNDTYNNDELMSRMIMMKVNKISFIDYKYLYRVNPNSVSMVLHPRRLGILDAQAWLIRFSLDNGFTRRDTARVVEASIGFGWWAFRNRRALGASDTLQKIDHLTTLIGRSMRTRDWLHIRPGHLAAFLFLRALHLGTPAAS